MDYFPRSFAEGLAERLTGPGKGRFVAQSLVAIALGVRDGIADAKQGPPPYFDRVLFTSKRKLYEVKTALKHIRRGTDRRGCYGPDLPMARFSGTLLASGALGRFDFRCAPIRHSSGFERSDRAPMVLRPQGEA
jgi:hypothetical protein